MKDSYRSGVEANEILAKGGADHLGAVTGQKWEAADPNVAAATEAIQNGTFPVVSPALPGDEVKIRR